MSNDYTSYGETIASSIPLCLNVPQVQSLCFQTSQPWVTFITSIEQIITMEVYPAFGLLQRANITTLLNTAELSEPTFGKSTITSRDINVYIPPSISQNTIKRPINILVANDGSYQEVETYVMSGFDVAVQTGKVPESILVGIPQTAPGVCNRYYELSYGNCTTGWVKYNRGSNPLSYDPYYGCPGTIIDINR